MTFSAENCSEKCFSKVLIKRQTVSSALLKIQLPTFHPKHFSDSDENI